MKLSLSRSRATTTNVTLPLGAAAALLVVAASVPRCEASMLAAEASPSVENVAARGIELAGNNAMQGTKDRFRKDERGIPGGSSAESRGGTSADRYGGSSVDSGAIDRHGKPGDAGRAAERKADQRDAAERAKERKVQEEREAAE